MNLGAIELSLLLPALLAGVLVIATHVPLGRQVLARGIIFIDLAVAQIAGLGAVAAYVAGWELGGWAVQLAAATSAVAGGLVLHWTERRWAEVQEAIIGSAFVLAATASVLLLSGVPHGAEQLQELLAGQILWVSLADLLPVAALYAVLLLAWFAFGLRRGLAFYLVFALAVTASVQLVGVFLVFASLIIPALAVRSLRGWRALAVGYGLGAAAYALGLLGSAMFDLPTGPLIVWMLAGLGLGVAVIRWLGAPER